MENPFAKFFTLRRVPIIGLQGAGKTNLWLALASYVKVKHFGAVETGPKYFSALQGQIYRDGSLTATRPGNPEPLCLKITHLPNVPKLKEFRISSGDIAGFDVEKVTEHFNNLVLNVPAIVTVINVTNPNGTVAEGNALKAICSTQLEPIFSTISSAGSKLKRVIFVVSRKDHMSGQLDRVTDALRKSMMFAEEELREHGISWNSEPIFVDSLGVTKHLVDSDSKPNNLDDVPVLRLLEEISNAL